MEGIGQPLLIRIENKQCSKLRKGQNRTNKGEIRSEMG